MMAAEEGLPVTVTHLQMKRPPEHYPHAPLGPQLALLRCRDIPLHFYRYIYDCVGREWHWTAAFRLDDDELAERLGDPAREVHVLYMNGAPAGFFEILKFEDGECRLMLFGLMRHAIGLGLSRWFLGCAIRRMWDLNPRLISVETCTLDHPAALPLYQKLGFEPVSRIEIREMPLPDEERMRLLFRR